MHNLTWDCMICHAERTDEFISVEPKPIRGLEAQFADGTRWNVRYCNDRPRCIEGAKAWSR